jgi:hypothetical protein
MAVISASLLFLGGIRNIWLIRDFSLLLEKEKCRTAVYLMIERALTDIISTANKAQKKKIEKYAKENANKAATKQDTAEQMRRDDEEGERLASSGGGVSAGDPHQVP